MCRFIGSKHRDYSPSRSVKVSYWRRLPTIHEATVVEMAEEIEISEKGEKRHDIEAEQLGKNALSPLLKTNNRSKPRKQRKTLCNVASLKTPDFVETGASRSYQQIQDEWSYLLRTPYADFLPESKNTSQQYNYFSLSTEKTEKTKVKVKSTDAYKLSEISAWLEFFG